MRRGDLCRRGHQVEREGDVIVLEFCDKGHTLWRRLVRCHQDVGDAIGPRECDGADARIEKVRRMEKLTGIGYWPQRERCLGDDWIVHPEFSNLITDVDVWIKVNTCWQTQAARSSKAHRTRDIVTVLADQCTMASARKCRDSIGYRIVRAAVGVDHHAGKDQRTCLDDQQRPSEKSCFAQTRCWVR